MGKDCTKTNENIYFKCRKEAALYDERLRSRESAADLLGVSPSSLADYELGNTKVVPVDKVHLMADLRSSITNDVLQVRLSYRSISHGSNRDYEPRYDSAKTAQRA